MQVCYPKRTDKPLYHGLVRQLESLGIKFIEAEEVLAGKLKENYSLVIDSIFGFSFQGAPRPPFDKILDALRPSADPPILVAVDSPSGWELSLYSISLSNSLSGSELSLSSIFMSIVYQVEMFSLYPTYRAVDRSSGWELSLYSQGKKWVCALSCCQQSITLRIICVLQSAVRGFLLCVLSFQHRAYWDSWLRNICSTVSPWFLQKHYYLSSKTQPLSIPLITAGELTLDNA